ncbi:Caspase domain-containing protein [Sphaerochaeta pleomorpha str. Grapes]|uniref:Caspase domain-containing protein n=1 Tax=Sphaerochaeta pleomorpha (strain ATCC BAA-1885 / DSM 22778 / Grapes) TaxID=158190 RepID=G8QYF1_SPHPG|nr:caspase family protein [Sphaerochaeta pleomorpha]AEV30798.1 Caspase domain-containing protein [Sphaerochaeta pleomorpha str. Grapes]
MKKRYILLLLLPLLLFTSCEFFTDEPSKGNVHVVSVGLNYHGTNANYLQGTLNDARELQEVLKKVSSNIERNGTFSLLIQDGGVLISEETYYKRAQYDYDSISDVDLPTKSKIIEILSELKDVNDNDLTIFTYSGHGDDEGALIVAPPRADGSIFDGSSNIYDDCRFTVKELLDAMEKIPGKKLLLIDSCYSGQHVAESSTSLSTVYSDYNFYAKFFSDESYDLSNLYVLSASANNTKSYEDYFDEADHNHGYFTYALLDALGWPRSHNTDLSSVIIDGIPPAARNSVVTVDSLYAYVLKHQLISSNKLYLSHQHPMTNGGAMDMVLFNF